MIEYHYENSNENKSGELVNCENFPTFSLSFSFP